MLVSQRPNIARLALLSTQEHSRDRNVLRGFQAREDGVLRVVGQRQRGGTPLETLPGDNGLPEPTSKPEGDSPSTGATTTARTAETPAGPRGTDASTLPVTATRTGTGNGTGTPTATNTPNPTNRTTTTTTTVTAPVMGSAAANAALAKLREASVRLRGVDLVDYNRDWARQMVESGTASNPAFYQLLEKAAAAIKEAYRKHLGREPTKDEMAMWLPFTPSMEANERQWATNVQRLTDRANLDQVSATIAARTSSAPPSLTDAQITDYIRANMGNPSAIATAMQQYGVTFARIQTATGASAADIATYVANSNNDTLKRMYAQQSAATAASKPTDAQINDYIRANINNPTAIATAMIAYNVSFARVQTALGASAADIAAYVASSGSDALKRLYAEQTAATAASNPTDAQINDYIRANIDNPSAIATAMIQYNVSFARVQTAIGASAADIAAYVAGSNSDALKRLYAQQTSTPAPNTPTTPATPTTPTAPAVTDAQVNDYIRANLQNPDAIATAMLQYGVSMSRVQSVLGASWDEIKAYVASSNNDTLKRLLVEAIGPG